jgi:DNA (cytosine-5)-methyltransferase 1
MQLGFFYHPESASILAKAREVYTQKDLASFLQYTPRQIARWEKGETPIPHAVLPALREIIQPAKEKQGEFTFIDLFAGIGGIRLGFESCGGQCAFTSEWDEYARKTYLANFHVAHPIAGDITVIQEDAIPDHDVLLAGFPCQPFSIAGVSKKNALGRPHGFECTTQGTLFFDVARILANKRPRAFLLENVKNLLSHNGGHTFTVIKDTLEKELGYHIDYKIFDGQHFVPQHRERILIAGFADKVDFSWKTMPLPDLGIKHLRDILHPEDGSEEDTDSGRFIDERGKVNSKYTLTTHLWEYLQAYAAKHRAQGHGFGCTVSGPDDVARTLSARYYKDGSEILVYRGKGKNPRRLTPRECARLMGFPDRFKIVVSDTRAYKQFGNSVVVPLMKQAAAHMKQFICRSIISNEAESYGVTHIA